MKYKSARSCNYHSVDMNICCRNASDSAMLGHLNCLKYNTNKYPHYLDKDTIDNAAMNGRLECLRYAHENGYHLDRGSILWAASFGYLDCLKYMCECDDPFPWNPSATYYAAKNGNIECLQYIYETLNLSWDESVLEGKPIEDIPENCRKFIEDNQDDWKHGLNKLGMNIKGAR